MPRLNNHQYLNRRHLLRLLWREHPRVYAVASVREQRQLHRYYQTQSNDCDQCLLAGRRRLTSAEPALPHVAGKAFHAVLAAFRLADNYAGEDDVAFNKAIGALAHHRLGEGAFVGVVARPESDLQLLARALLHYEPRSDDPRSSASS